MPYPRAMLIGFNATLGTIKGRRLEIQGYTQSSFNATLGTIKGYREKNTADTSLGFNATLGTIKVDPATGENSDSIVSMPLLVRLKVRTTCCFCRLRPFQCHSWYD